MAQPPPSSNPIPWAVEDDKFRELIGAWEQSGASSNLLLRLDNRDVSKPMLVLEEDGYPSTPFSAGDDDDGAFSDSSCQAETHELCEPQTFQEGE